VTTSRLESEEGASERFSDLRLDAWVLCAEFVQQIVSEARAGFADDLPGVIPEVDWASIWQAGNGAACDEAAIGRIVRAASEAARGLSPPPGEASSPPTHRSNGAAVLEGVPAASPPAVGADSDVPAEPFAYPAQRASVLVQPSAPLADPVPDPAAPSEPGAESLTPPVTAATSVAGPATVEWGPPTAQVDLVQVDAVPIVRPAFGEESEESRDVRPEVAVASPAMPAHSAWFHVFTWARNVGLIILVFVVWQLWGTSISQHHAQGQLKSEFNALVAQHAAGSHRSKSSLISAATRVLSPVDGSVVAEIQIPAIGVDQYVVEGTTETDLSKGPGHYIGTAMPGQAGNVAIAGHRTTNGAPFVGLGRLVPGDRIILTTTYGQNLTYVVSGTPQAVAPTDVGVLNYFGDNRITLTTCNPEFSSSQRLVVVGMLKQPLASPAVDAKHVSYHVVNPAIASWNWSLLPTVGVEVCLLLLLALSYRRFDTWFERTGKWLILLPLWAAGLYLLFGTLTKFLPAAL
jgi:LPXTG-site transpeptidase (sortase) family protein